MEFTRSNWRQDWRQDWRLDNQVPVVSIMQYLLHPPLLHPFSYLLLEESLFIGSLLGVTAHVGKGHPVSFGLQVVISDLDAILRNPYVILQVCLED
jgi:hypothetical protein